MRRTCVCLLVSAALGSAACGTSSSETSGLTGAGARGGRGGGGAVNVEPVGIQHISIQREVELSGTLLSPDQAKVSSEVAGIVRAVPVELGTTVRAGDVLVRLEPRELQLAFERAESAMRQVEAQLGIDRANDRQPPPDEQIASVRQATANRDDARAAYARAQELNSRGLLSQVDRDTADTRQKVAEANYQAAIDNVRALKASLQDRRASYELAQKKLADALIKAPVAGSVAERLVQPGEFIRENTPVATIVQINPLRLKTGIQEKFAGVVTPGQPVEFHVEAFPGQTYHGKVTAVSPSVDQTTRTFTIEAIVDNADRTLKPGFFAKGTVATKLDENVMAVPEDAVSTLAGVSAVYVIEEGKIRQQIVSLGVHQDKVWEITDGLKGDEQLAGSNLNQLATGTPVRTGGKGEGNGPAGNGGRGRRGGRGEAR